MPLHPPYAYLSAALLLVLATGGCSDRGAAQPDTQLTRDMLDQSLSLGRQFMLNNQRPDGRFHYEYDFVARRDAAQDHPARQAGALWGLALIHHDQPSPETAAAVARGLDFFHRVSNHTVEGWRVPEYERGEDGRTGTVALLCLTLIEVLRTDDALGRRIEFEHDLGRYMKFLLSLRRPDGRFWGAYDPQTGGGRGRPSPYADGEALLAMVKAARYAGMDDLRQPAVETAQAIYEAYVTEARQANPDSDLTKGVYQWASMAFFEMHDAGWDTGNTWARRTIELAHWMIDTHRTLERERNTGYAYEGIIVARELARRMGDDEAVAKFDRVIDQGMAKLTSWQVGGPNLNAFLRNNPTDDPRALGGVMGAADEPRLRIDTTQHQMHAVILARRWVYE